MVAVWLYPACFAAALVYASVGMGGGSTYLALLSLTTASPDAIRVAALVMNLVVAGGGFLLFRKAGHFHAKLLFPFIVASLPASFLGGMIHLPVTLFRIVLAATLLVVAGRMLFKRTALFEPRDVSWTMAWRYGPFIGAVLGLVAGLVGIGGGVFLAPVLIMMGWADGKRAAAAASAFVLLNSMAGLVGHIGRGNFPELWTWPLLLAVFVGGQVGARIGAFKLSPLILQRLFGCVVLAVVINLVYKTLS